jgi:hypothetical protein
MCLWVSYKKKVICFASLKSLKKGVESGSGQNVTDPRHWVEETC